MVLIDEKSYENIWVYGIWDRTLTSTKPLLIRFSKKDEYIILCHRGRYLVLFGPEKNDVIYNRIRYLISIKSDATYLFSHNYAKIKIASYDSL